MPALSERARAFPVRIRDRDDARDHDGRGRVLGLVLSGRRERMATAGENASRRPWHSFSAADSIEAVCDGSNRGETLLRAAPNRSTSRRERPRWGDRSFIFDYPSYPATGDVSSRGSARGPWSKRQVRAKRDSKISKNYLPAPRNEGVPASLPGAENRETGEEEDR